MSYERYNYHKSTLENQSVGIYQCCIYQALFVFRIKSPVGRGNDGCYYLLRGNVKVSDSQINLLINIHTGNDEEDSRAPGTPGQQAAQPEDDCPLVLLVILLVIQCQILSEIQLKQFSDRTKFGNFIYYFYSKTSLCVKQRRKDVRLRAGLGLREIVVMDDCIKIHLSI